MATTQTPIYLNHPGFAGPIDSADGLMNFGLQVVLVIPPQLDYLRYPNLVNNVGSPVLSNEDLQYMKDLRKRFFDYKNVPGKDVDQNGVPLKKFSAEFDITNFIKSLSWTSSRENNFINVNMSLDNFQGMFNHLPEGAKILIKRRKSVKNKNGKSSGTFYPFLTVYVADKSRSSSGGTEEMTLTCNDRLAFLRAVPLQGSLKKKPVFKDKTASEITKAVCDNIGFPIGNLPTSMGGKKLTKIKQLEQPENAYAGDYITQAWYKQYQTLPRANRVTYAIHARQGFLEVEFLKRPGANGQKEVYVFTDDFGIEDGSLEESLDDDVYTVLTATATINSKKKNKRGKLVTTKRKVTKTFYPKNAIVMEAFGKKPTSKNLGVLTSRQQFEEKGQATVDRLSRPKRTFSFKSTGWIMGLWPMKYIHIKSRYFGIKGNFPIDSITYNLEGGIMTMDIQLRMDLPAITATPNSTNDSLQSNTTEAQTDSPVTDYKEFTNKELAAEYNDLTGYTKRY